MQQSMLPVVDVHAYETMKPRLHAACLPTSNYAQLINFNVMSSVEIDACTLVFLHRRCFQLQSKFTSRPPTSSSVQSSVHVFIKQTAIVVVMTTFDQCLCDPSHSCRFVPFFNTVQRSQETSSSFGVVYHLFVALVRISRH